MIHSTHFSIPSSAWEAEIYKPHQEGLCLLAVLKNYCTPSGIARRDSEERGQGVYSFDYPSMFALSWLLSSQKVH